VRGACTFPSPSRGSGDPLPSVGSQPLRIPQCVFQSMRAASPPAHTNFLVRPRKSGVRYSLVAYVADLTPRLFTRVKVDRLVRVPLAWPTTDLPGNACLQHACQAYTSAHTPPALAVRLRRAPPTSSHAPGARRAWRGLRGCAACPCRRKFAHATMLLFRKGSTTLRAGSPGRDWIYEAALVAGDTLNPWRTLRGVVASCVTPVSPHRSCGASHLQNRFPYAALISTHGKHHSAPTCIG
jgi:hypothetical protein